MNNKNHVHFSARHLSLTFSDFVAMEMTRS